MTDNTPVLLRKIADAYKITAKKLYDQSYVEQRGGFEDLSRQTLANSMVFQFLDEGIRSVLDTAEQPTPPAPKLTSWICPNCEYPVPYKLVACPNCREAGPSSSTDSGIVERLNKIVKNFAVPNAPVSKTAAEAAACIATLSSRIETLEKDNDALEADLRHLDTLASYEIGGGAKVFYKDVAEKAEAEAKRLREGGIWAHLTPDDHAELKRVFNLPPTYPNLSAHDAHEFMLGQRGATYICVAQILLTRATKRQEPSHG